MFSVKLFALITAGSLITLKIYSELLGIFFPVIVTVETKQKSLDASPQEET